MMNKLFLLSMFFLIILTGCTKETKKPSEERQIPVSISEVTTQDVPVYFNTFGHIVSPVSVDIRPQVSGVIKENYVKQGQDVKKGDPLYLIDPQSFQLALDKAKAILTQSEANLTYAKEKLKRYTNLVQGNFVSQLTIDEYTRDVKLHESIIEGNKADVGIAEENLSYSRITSPIDGRVGLTKIDPGNLVVQNDIKAIIQIQQINPIDIVFSIPQREFERIQLLLNKDVQNIKIFLPSDPSNIFEGEVFAFDNTLDPWTGTIKLKGRINNDKEILWPGEFVQVRLFIKIKEQALVIPKVAVQLGEKGSYVYVLKPDMKAEPVYVKVSDNINNMVVVDEGLEKGMKIITDGQINILPGSIVTVVPELTKK